MGKELNDIAKNLMSKNKKVQLIYAFNGTGKTRLSRAFKELIAAKDNGQDAIIDAEQAPLSRWTPSNPCSGLPYRTVQNKPVPFQKTS